MIKNSYSVIFREANLHIDENLFTCALCSLPFNNPHQCMCCDNIFCKVCIDEYQFQHGICPVGCSLLNTFKIKRTKRLNIESIKSFCNHCLEYISIIDVQQHCEAKHQYQYSTEKKRFEKKIYCSPRAIKGEDEHVFEDISFREKLKSFEDLKKDFVCQICFNPLSQDCSQCFSCEQIWCQQCLTSYSNSNKQYECPNKCLPSHFIHPPQGFFSNYCQKFSLPCEKCQKEVPSEYYQEHMRRYHEIIQINDSQSSNYYQQALIQKENFSYLKAIDLASIAIMLNPFSRNEAFFQKGYSYSMMNLFKQAIVNYKQQLKLTPKDKIINFNLGINYARLRYFEEAEKHYLASLEFDSSFLQAYNNLGCLYQEMKDYSKALDMFQKCIQINNKIAFAYDSKGQLLLELKRYDEALEDFEKSISLDKQYAPPYEGKGKYYLFKKNYLKAIDFFGLAVEYDSSNSNYKQLLNLAQKQKEQVIKFGFDIFKIFRRGNQFTSLIEKETQKYESSRMINDLELQTYQMPNQVQNHMIETLIIQTKKDKLIYLLY